MWHQLLCALNYSASEDKQLSSIAAVLLITQLLKCLFTFWYFLWWYMYQMVLFKSFTWSCKIRRLLLKSLMFKRLTSHILGTTVMNTCITSPVTYPVFWTSETQCSSIYHWKRSLMVLNDTWFMYCTRKQVPTMWNKNRDDEKNIAPFLPAVLNMAVHWIF